MMGKNDCEMKWIIVLLIVALTGIPAAAQYSDLKLGEKNRAEIDSLKKTEYPYKLPIFGRNAHELGFSIPLPLGVSFNYYWNNQGILIDGMQLAVNDNPLQDFDFVEFGDLESSINSYSFRVDVWLFPFLNIYGIYGFGNSVTTTTVVFPVEFTTVTRLSGNTYGMGMTGAFGLGWFWMAIDGNWTWTNLEAFTKPVRASILAPRLGHTFDFSNRKDHSLALWVGGMRMRLSSETEGRIKLSEVIPPDFPMDELLENIDDWYNDLLPPVQETVDQIIDAIQEQTGGTGLDTEIHYLLQKRPKDEWNLLLGAQYHPKKNWQIRAEVGIGGRKSFLLNVNYRFGFKK
jgi:hypothetical protein